MVTTSHSDVDPGSHWGKNAVIQYSFVNVGCSPHFTLPSELKPLHWKAGKVGSKLLFVIYFRVFRTTSRMTDLRVISYLYLGKLKPLCAAQMHRVASMRTVVATRTSCHRKPADWQNLIFNHSAAFAAHILFVINPISPDNKIQVREIWQFLLLFR